MKIEMEVAMILRKVQYVSIHQELAVLEVEEIKNQNQ